ncbi:MAG: hypothetical protein ATN33_08155 [Epulopiscium sp. Nele67-Bin001]|nr:MAG: hypothetical protein BEN18_01640 [Epulopiscium sp. Nuni2H_MBin001]OON92024.1 MAG: hypothetical protein ATN33_08155 [Epulopiscium sp. Nele67-Bin001]
MLVTAFQTATFSNAANQTANVNTGNDFKQALDNAASTKDNNNNNSYNKNSNNDYNKSNTQDKSKTKDTTKTTKQNDTTTNKSNEVSKQGTKTNSKGNAKTVKEISPEEALEMLAGYLQITPEQLNETLEILEINVDDLLNNPALLDDIIADNFSFEELLVDSDLQGSIMELKTLLDETAFVLPQVEEQVVAQDFTELVEVEDAFKNTFLENVKTDTNTMSEDTEIEIEFSTVNDIEVDPKASLRGDADTDSDSSSKQNNANAQQTNFEFVGDTKIETNFNIPTSYRGITVANSNGSSLLGGSSDVQYKPVVTQLIDNIQIVKLADGTQLTMDLDPQDLGKISLTVVENSGIIKADIKVDSEKVKEMVLEQIDALKAALEDQGLTVGEFNVDVQQEENKYQEHMNQERAKSQKRIEELIDLYMDEEFESDSEVEKDVTQLKHDKNVNVRI